MSQRGAMVVVGLALLAAPAAASEDYVWKPYVAATYAIPMGKTEAKIGNEVREVKLADAPGLEAGVEWKYARYYGIELAYGRTKHDIEFGGGRLGDATSERFSIGFNCHIKHGERLDFWLGPIASWGHFRESDLRRGVEEGDNSDYGFGLTVGADWLMGKTWALTGGVRYYDLQMGLGPRGEIAIDPLVFRFGVAWKL